MMMDPSKTNFRIFRQLLGSNHRTRSSCSVDRCKTDTMTFFDLPIGWSEVVWKAIHHSWRQSSRH